MYVCMYVCMYIFMYVCMHAYINSYNNHGGKGLLFAFPSRLTSIGSSCFSNIEMAVG